MQFELKLLQRFNYSKKEYAFIKISTVLLWLFSVWKITTEYNSQPFPEGICKLVNCAYFAISPISLIVLFFAVIASIAYVFERFMIVSLTYLTFTSLILLSLERSNGILDRLELWTMIFSGQLIAYFRFRWQNNYFKSANVSARDISLFYSLQMIAAAYVVAGITKLQTAGFDWVIDSPNLVFQLKKISNELYIDFGWKGVEIYSEFIENYFLKNTLLTQITFLFALLIELFAIVICLGRKYAFYYGWLLLLLHIGIALTMFVIIPIYLFVVVLFLLFPRSRNHKTFSISKSRFTSIA